jgi:uncharacterized protein (TIGR03000 family)
MKRLYGFVGTALLSAGVLMLIAGDTFAQRGRGGRGGGWGSGYGGYGSGWGYGGYGSGWGSGYGGWGYSGSGWGWSPGTGLYLGSPYYGSNRGYYDGYGYGSYYSPSYGYRSYYYPGYYDSGYSYPSYSMPSYDSGPAPMYSSAPPAQNSNVANIEVKVPDPNAKVQFDGQPTNQTGTTRLFTTPPLSSGDASYRISASWQGDRGMVTQERTVTVRPGANVTVDFTQQQGPGNPPAPKPRPPERVQDR